MDKKKIKFTIEGTYPINDSKNKHICQECQCEKLATKTVLIETGSICVLIRLCENHAEYLEGMREL